MTRTDFINTLKSSGFVTYGDLNVERMGIRRIIYTCMEGNYFHVRYYFTDGSCTCFRGSYAQSWHTPDGHIQTNLNEI